MRARLQEAESTLEAIRQGAVDAILVAGPQRDQVFTLKSAETPYRVLVEAMNEGALTLTPDGTILFANGRFAEMVRTPLQDVIGTSLRRFVPPPEQPALDGLIERASPSKRDFTLKAAGATLVPVQLSLSSLQVDEFRAVSLVVTDLTERKRAEEELYRLNQLYAVLSRVNESILRIRSRQELFQQVCEVAVKYGGFKLAWIGWHDLDTHAVIPVAQTGDDQGYLRAIRIYADDRPEGHGPTGTCIRGGTPNICNDFANDPHTTPWHEAAAARGLRASAAIPIRLGNKVCGAFMVYADVSNYFQEKEVALLEEVAADISFALDNLEMEAQRARAERELATLNVELERRVQERTAQLEAANKDLEAFAYSVSHDLRAPLRHLDGFAQLLLKRAGAQLDATSAHYGDAISAAAAKMNRLIDSLLAFSRAGRTEMHSERVALDPMVAEVQAELTAVARDRRITWDIAPLPTVDADPALLRQVWVNLLSNAIKFTAPRAEACIAIKATDGENGEVVISVRDNGVGFDPQYAHKLFGVFQRLHAEEAFEGVGIGLSNVRRIIERHGGRVWAEGAVDQGATFYFTLNAALSREQGSFAVETLAAESADEHRHTLPTERSEVAK